jgi:hypothetical protein
MELKYLDRIKEKYAYQQWASRNVLEEKIFIWRLVLTPDVLERWEPEKIQRIELIPRRRPEHAAAKFSFGSIGEGLTIAQWNWKRGQSQTRSSTRRHEAAEAPRLSLKSLVPFSAPHAQEPPYLAMNELFWRPTEESHRALVSGAVYECASQDEAHTFLLQLLAQFQLPNISQREDLSIGDVSFGTDTDTLVLFARGNLVCLVRNAERETVSVLDHARQLDAYLIKKPEPVKSKAKLAQRPKIRLAETEAPEQAELILEADETGDILERFTPPEHPSMYKIFARSGELFESQGHLIYRPPSTGQKDLTIFVIDQDGSSSKQRLGVNVKQQ